MHQRERLQRLPLLFFHHDYRAVNVIKRKAQNRALLRYLPLAVIAVGAEYKYAFGFYSSAVTVEVIVLTQPQPFPRKPCGLSRVSTGDVRRDKAWQVRV